MTGVICKINITLKMKRPSQHGDASSKTKASDANSEQIVREHAHAKLIPLGKRTKAKRTHIIVARDTDAEKDLR